MTITQTVFKGASWLALFKMISQLFSWAVTIIVARLLIPDDYALSAMATIITSYAELFSGLGLAHSLIHKTKLKESELSSVFWFALGVSFLFALSCVPFSYITASIFDEVRVVPVTQAAAVIFILSGLQVVPQSLVRKELQFKTIGLIEMQSTIISCIGMLIIANLDGGVWTLIGGRIIRSIVGTILIYRATEWRPTFHFNFAEAKHHLSFGVIVALGGTMFYVFEASDRFFAGRAWSLTDLGYYLFALQLSNIPTVKVVSLLNVVSFPAFSKLKDDPTQLRLFYLKVMKVTAVIVLPIFMGGFLVGEELVKALLDEKWVPMIHLFEFLCLVQIITALNSLNNQLYIALGKPRMALYFDGFLAMTMPLSFYLALEYITGINAILYPWFTTYLLASIIWIIVTIKSLGINVTDYLKNISTAIIGTFLVMLSVIGLKPITDGLPINDITSLMLLTTIPGVVYVTYFYVFNRPLVNSIISVVRQKRV